MSFWDRLPEEVRDMATTIGAAAMGIGAITLIALMVKLSDKLLS